MRTLKKSLCLVLALVFVLGLCTIGAGAATFSDDAKVTYKNAVNVMAGLGIIKGDDNDGDGKMEFRPKDTITRAEAAVIIARMILGDNYEKLPKASTSFTDVGPGMSEWAQSAIAFCEARGIVNGRGDGKYYPQDNVTGLEMAKMLLCANGYGGDGKFTGKGWSINVFTEATTNKVFKNVADSVDFEAPATREQCALYTLNTLQNVKQLEVGSDGKLIEKSTMGEQVWNMKSKQGQVVANKGTGADYTEVVVKEKDENDVLQTVTYKFDYDYEGAEPLDLIAHEVKVFYNDEGEMLKDSNGNAYYSAYEVEDVSRVASNGFYLGDLYKSLTSANKANATKALNEISVWENYTYNATPDISGSLQGNAGYTTVADYENRNTGYSFTLGKFVLAEDGTILAYLTDSFTTAGVVTSVDSKGVKINTSTATISGFTVTYTVAADGVTYTEYPEGIKKGDLVTIQEIGDRKILKPVTITEPVTITQWTPPDYFFSFVRSFENGKYSSSRAYAPTLIEKSVDPGSVNVDDVVRFYLDVNGNFICIEEVEVGSGSEVFFINKEYTKAGAVDDYGNADTTTYLQCVNAEGEEVSFAEASTFTGFTGRGTYTMTVDAKGKVTKVTATAKQVFGKDSGKASYLTSGTDKTYYISSDTKVYFVNESTGATATTAKALKITTGALPSADPGNIYAAIKANAGTGSSVTTIWVYGSTAAPEASDKLLFVSSTSTKGTDADGAYYTAYVDGTETEKLHIGNPSVMTKGEFYTFTVDKDGIYTLTSYTTRVVANYTLAKGDIANGKLYYKADGKAISNAVVNLMASRVQTPDGKDYVVINDLNDIENLVNDGYAVTVSYTHNTSGVPTGNIYVTNLVAP